jgi:hypothetical protein
MSTPIHTGEPIYLRQNFKPLIETHAVNLVGPDPADVGGIAELKWSAEYADLHGILMAPHGTGEGVFGLAAPAQVCATLPNNFIAFEYPIGQPNWWYEIVEGLPDPFVQDGLSTSTPGPGQASASTSTSRPRGPTRVKRTETFSIETECYQRVTSTPQMIANVPALGSASTENNFGLTTGL